MCCWRPRLNNHHPSSLLAMTLSHLHYLTLALSHLRYLTFNILSYLLYLTLFYLHYLTYITIRKHPCPMHNSAHNFKFHHAFHLPASLSNGFKRLRVSSRENKACKCTEIQKGSTISTPKNSTQSS